MRRLWTLSSRATRQRLALSHTHQGDVQFIKALTPVLKVLLRVGVSSAFGVLKVELSSASPGGYSAE